MNKKEPSFTHYSLFITNFLLLLAALFRLAFLTDLPVGLSQDEVLNADIVEGILAGRHAIFFREGFGHEPLYHYFSAPFQLLLGDNWVSIKFPAFALSMIGVALAMRWARREFGTNVSLWTGAGLAVAWWPVIFGRLGLRPILLPVCLVLVMWWYERKPVWAGVALTAAFYTYTPAWVMAGLPIGFGLMKRLRRQSVIVGATALLLSSPLIWTLITDPSLLERGGQLSGPLTALLAGDPNPLVSAILRTIGAFGFVSEPRLTYGLLDQPLLNLVLGIFLLAGIFFALTLGMRGRMVVIWFVLGILPSMLTPDAPSSIRMIGAVIPTFTLIGIYLDSLGQLSGRERLVNLLGYCLWVFVGISTVLTGIQWREEGAFKYQGFLAQTVKATDGDAVIGRNFYYPIDDDSVRRMLGTPHQTRFVQGGKALIFTADELPLYLDPDGVALDEALIPWRDAPYDFTFEPAVSEKMSDYLRLDGFSVDASTVLYAYTVLATPPSDIRLFTHAVETIGQPPLTQDDSFDAIPAFLQAGDRILQVQRVPLSDGNCLVHGVYLRESGERISPLLSLTPDLCQ